MKKLLTALLVVLPICQSAQAATVTNGDFSAGLAGWTTQGNVSTNAGHAVLTSAGSGVDTSAFGGTNGSILTQAINAAVGDVVSFSFNFMTNDYMPYNDFSLVAADSNRLLSSVFTLGNTFGNSASTGWQTFSFVATANFTNLSFVLSNALDNLEDSTLFVDNVQVASTPIPAALWLFGSGIAGLIGLSRKKKAAV